MTHTIGFELTPSLEKEPEGDETYSSRYTQVRCDVLIDGHSATKGNGYFFDLGLLLSLSTTPARYVYPFTCGCGVPGCIGIDAPACFEVGEGFVTWVLPRDPFERTLRADLVPSVGPIRLTFERGAYERTLQEAVDELERISAATNRLVNIWPDPFGPETSSGNPLPLQEQIAYSRERLLAWEEHLTQRETTWGPLLSKELVLSLPNGYVYSIPYDALGQALLECTPESSANEDAYLANEIVPKLRKDLQKVIETAKAVSWPKFRPHLYPDYTSPAGVTDTEYENLPLWPDVTFSERTYT